MDPFPRVDIDALFGAELELCRLRAGETVGIYTEDRARLDYADAFRRAAEKLGASSFHLDVALGNHLSPGELGVRSGNTGLGLAGRAAVDAFKGADLMVDLAFLLWSPEQSEIKGAGTRILSCVEPVPVLARMFPSHERRDRVLRARDLLASVSRLRLTNDAGTDVAFEIGQYLTHHQYGFTDEPGRWDHFGTAIVNTVPNDSASQGVVVFQPGDIVFPYSRYVSEPVRLTVRDGRVTEIEGGADALLIREYLAMFDDERGYHVSHIGWGMDERSRWDALAAGSGGIGMDARCALGSVMFSTGPNVEFGGSNDTPCHMDMPMRDCSLWLDDTLLIDRGHIVDESLLPSQAV
jgi:2,5-dihydroxypyridine 5,6-dioxygenase